MRDHRKLQFALILGALLLLPSCKRTESEHKSEGGDKVLSDYVHKPLDAASGARGAVEKRDADIDDEARQLEEEQAETDD